MKQLEVDFSNQTLLNELINKSSEIFFIENNSSEVVMVNNLLDKNLQNENVDHDYEEYDIVKGNIPTIIDILHEKIKFILEGGTFILARSKLL